MPGITDPQTATGTLLESVRCPRCTATLDVRARPIVCPGCRQSYPLLGEIPVLLADAEDHLASARTQLTQLERQAQQTIEDLQSQMRAPDALPATTARCQAMVEGLRNAVADVRAILDSLLPPAGTQAREPSLRVPTNLEYLHYLYRDWGRSGAEDGENERALAMLESVLGETPLGRTLVVGAGACRLAYDLHRRHPGTETVVVDLDPLLFATAHAIVRGGSVVVREVNLEIGELAQSSREWVLRAPAGSVADTEFHFILTDGLEPPFAPAAFDSVVTPWFIDQGPDDLRDFISTVYRMLHPGGRWLNIGPFRYGNGVPIALRFGREELFDLAARAGFRVEGWETASVPYLVSGLNGRGKVEWVLAFSASKLDVEPAALPRDGGPPSWLIFNHLPVPTFTGQSMAWSGTRGYQLVISAIDGKRTIDDIARLIDRQAREASVSLSDIRSAVRQCLIEVHPECRPTA